jgi:sulfide:quinone oxidoreductase
VTSTTRTSSEPFQVVIAGGGVAALEAALALRDLHAAHVHVTLLAPNDEFVYRPMTVREPFAYAAAQRYDIADIARDIGVELVVDSLAWLESESRIVHTAAGETLDYDAVVLAVGARPQPRYDHALTLDDRRLDELLHGLIQDVEGGYLKHVAFVIPPRVAWPLPIYELALMTAGRAHDMNIELAVTVVTPEEVPLAVFGAGASTAVSALLAERGVTVMSSSWCEVTDGRHLVVHPGAHGLDVDRIVALPELYGPALRGLPAGDHGLIPVDSHCRVRGVERVYAAGDATDYPLKYGGIAAQQADTAAQAIAALAGLAVEPAPFEPVIHGILLTGAAPRYLSAKIVGGQAVSSEVTDTPTWSPPAKIVAKYLAPYLAERDRLAGAAR